MATVEIIDAATYKNEKTNDDSLFVLNIYILLLKIIQNQEASLYKASILALPSKWNLLKIKSCCNLNMINYGGRQHFTHWTPR